MFGKLNERLEKIVNSLRGKAIISEPDVDLTMREIRIALLEADVALPVVKDFINLPGELTSLGKHPVACTGLGVLKLN